jgi:hypothetical protein
MTRPLPLPSVACPFGGGRTRLRLGAAATAFVLVGSPILPAQAAHVVYSPLVEEGEMALELRGHYDVDGAHGTEGAASHKAEFEWAPASRWLTALGAEFEREPGANLKATEASWENILQLTEQGRYWADFGLLLEYAHSLDDAEDKIEVGLLGEKSLSRHTTTVNVKFERDLSGSADTEVEYAAQYRYRLREEFEPGLELYGELGNVGEFGALSTHEHQLGPAVFGKLRAGRAALKYQGGVLFGLTEDSPGVTLRFMVEYEF